jgi:hypothetical protein
MSSTRWRSCFGDEHADRLASEDRTGGGDRGEEPMVSAAEARSPTGHDDDSLDLLTARKPLRGRA